MSSLKKKRQISKGWTSIILSTLRRGAWLALDLDVVDREDTPRDGRGCKTTDLICLSLNNGGGACQHRWLLVQDLFVWCDVSVCVRERDRQTDRRREQVCAFVMERGYDGGRVDLDEEDTHSCVTYTTKLKKNVHQRSLKQRLQFQRDFTPTKIWIKQANSNTNHF